MESNVLVGKRSLGVASVAAMTAVGFVNTAPAAGSPPAAGEDPFEGWAVQIDSLETALADQPSAPTIEESGLFGADQIRAERARLVASLNKSATEEFGEFTPAKATRLGRSNYFEDRDVNVFVVPRPNRPNDVESPGSTNDGILLLATSLHTRVTPEGAIQITEQPNALGLGQPIFDGPWGAEAPSPWFNTWAEVDDGGISCNDTHGELRGKTTRRFLNDNHPDFRYAGVSVSGVAEITDGANDCDDYIDWFAIGLNTNNPESIWLEQDPLSDFSGDCEADTTLSLGGSWGGVNAGISQSFRECEDYEVTGGNVESAEEIYKIDYDNSGNCGAENREALLLAVVRLDDKKFTWTTWGGIDPDNTPSSSNGC